MTRESSTALDVVRLDELVERLALARQEVGRVVFGQTDVIDKLLLVLLTGGHALIEGAPGLGKTLLARTFGAVFGLETKRVQFTPDLMPADITGTNVLNSDDTGRMHTRFQRGPVFTQLLLADEINRATPKTQSALLEAMQERTVTVAGTQHMLPRPFMVMATQNPIEMEGTYGLPEAQIDRFLLKIDVGFPSDEVLDDVLRNTTGPVVGQAAAVFDDSEVLELQEIVRAMPVADDIRGRVVRFVAATHPDRSDHPEVQRHVRYGISPRGAQAWLLAAKANALLRGRFATDVGDLEYTLVSALQHRLQLGFDAERNMVTSPELLRMIFKRAITSGR